MKKELYLKYFKEIDIEILLNTKYEKKKEIKILALSDLQILQKNLLKYEYETRLKNIYQNKVISLDEYNNSTSEEMNHIMIESCFYMINKYKQYIIDNIGKFNTFIDNGDFIFNISDIKYNLLISSGLYKELKSIFDILKSNNISTILILGNHDKLKYKELYEELFDCIIEKGTFFKNNKLHLFSHYPLLKEGKGNKGIKQEGKDEYSHILSLNDFGFYYKLLKEREISEEDIVNIHGHTHTYILPDNVKFKGVKYINVCLDYLLLTNTQPEII